jgi:hypothetical protein
MSELSVGQLRGLTVNNNVVSVPSGHTLYAPGHIVQVAQGVKRDTWSAGGGSTTFYEVSGYSVSLTPKSTTSKILVSGMIHISSWYWEIQGRIYRNGAVIDDATGNARGIRTRATFTQNLYEGTGGVRNSWASVAFEYLDTPGTISPVTYSVALNGYGAGAIAVNYNVYADENSADYFANPISTITAMEIAQ